MHMSAKNCALGIVRPAPVFSGVFNLALTFVVSECERIGHLFMLYEKMRAPMEAGMIKTKRWQ